MDVSIVVVNYNTLDLLVDCIESVYEQTNGVVYEIIVVDNASKDDSVNVIRKRYPEIVVIVNEQNVGFGRANNIGISKSQGKYVFMLNSDTILLNNAVKIFFDFMECNTDSKIGAVGAIMLDCERKANYSNSYNRFFTFGSFIQDIFCNLIKYKKKYTGIDSKLRRDGSLIVDFIVGADLFCPKEVLERVGGFDPIFFMYYEEADMQLSFKKLGFDRRIVYGPQIVHLEEGSTSKHMSSHKWEIYSRSMFQYFRKNRPKIELIGIKVGYILVAIFGGIFKFYKTNFRYKLHFIRAIIRN